MGDVERLKKQRAGKKRSITRRINTIRRVISEEGRPKEIASLLKLLLGVHRELTDICEQISELAEYSQLDIDWLEAVNCAVDKCTAEVESYLELHKDDDSSSEGSLTKSWVDRHRSYGSEAGLSDTASNMDATLKQDIAELDSLMEKQPRHVIIEEPQHFSPFSSARATHGSVSRGIGGFPPSTHQLGAHLANLGTSASTWNPPPLPGFGKDSQYLQWRQSDGDDLTRLQHQHIHDSDKNMNNMSSILQPSKLLYQSSTPMQPLGVPPGTTEPNVVFSSKVASTSAGYSTSAPARHSDGLTSSRNQARHSPPHVDNEVDSWIDLLHPSIPSNPTPTKEGISSDVTLSWLVQHSLPKPKIPCFDGSDPLRWVSFITKFRDLIHKQGYLSDEQRSMYLLDHLSGEAKKSVAGFSNDTRGYVLSLQRLKFLFGQRSKIAKAALKQITRGKQVPDHDPNALSDFYYAVSDCLVLLAQLNYESDLRSSDTLSQAVRRLPSRYHMTWAEHSIRIRERGEEPNLMHLESWLQLRVLASREASLPDQRNNNQRRNDKSVKDSQRNEGSSFESRRDDQKRSNMIGTTLVKPVRCSYCDGKHRITKCDSYSKLTTKERYEFAVQKNRCFNCLGIGHSTSGCLSKNTCFVDGCRGKHHTTLHAYFIEKEKHSGKETKKDETAAPKNEEKAKPDTMSNEKKEEKPTKDSYNGLVNSTRRDVFLQVVPVVLQSSSGKEESTYALLDDGSESTMLRADMAKKLDLKGEPDELYVSTVLEKAKGSIPTKETQLTVSSTDHTFDLELESVQVVSADKFNMPGRPRLEDCDYFTHLDGVETDAISPNQITMLIGGDEPEAHIWKDYCRGRKDQPLAVKTPFGWTLFGSSVKRFGHSKRRNVSINHLQAQHAPPDELVTSTVEKLWEEEYPSTSININTVVPPPDKHLNELVQSFWTQEFVGILPEKDTAPSIEDRQLLEKLEHETTFEDGHYTVPMLWGSDVVNLPRNLPMAKKRFNFLRKRLRANPEILKIYDAIIQDYVAKGYARRMLKAEADLINPKTWFLPHHPVFTPNKPGKMRVVKDAAAAFEGSSLNSSLRSGPDILNSLVGVVIRMRTGPIAIGADIEAMFHQVRVPKDDADSLRFLWSDDMFSEDEPYVMQMLVHIFGAKDSPTCANYALKRTARDHYKDFDALTFETALKAFYVDDLLKSVESDDVAIRLVKQLIEMMKRAGFKLTKFVSNSKAVIDSLPQSEVAPSMTFDIEIDNLQRALGIFWDVSSDRFTFTFDLPEAPFTKRGILRVTCSLFDPLGFLIPFILLAKLLLQELWRKGFDWDDSIDEQSSAYWKKWLNNAANVSKVYVDRCFNSYLDEPVIEVQLHVFSDASEAAYGAVAYFRFSFKTGRHSCSFIMSKSKLAPLKTITLPRLEFNGAVCGVRLFKTIIRETDLPVERVFFWTDSTLTIQYINNTTHRLKIYIANRQTEVLEATEPTNFRHVSGDLNPADMLTRGIKDPAELMNPKGDVSWFSCAAFLHQDEENWPTTEIGPLDPTDPEIRKKSVLVGLGIIEKDVIDPNRFSTWTKLLRVVGWVKRFLNNKFSKNGIKLSGQLSVAEIEASEMTVLRLVQQDEFDEELKILNDEDNLPVKNKLSPLSPFVDENGMLRVGGRLKNAPIPPSAKHQIILPKDSPVTTLIVIHYHRLNGHVGKEHTLSSLRERYWVINGRSAIKSCLRKCFFCRFRRALRLYPLMADLPPGRLAFNEPPFSHCGVDLFGPILIKQGRKRLKRWGVLFTCLTIRCVHLELVESIDTDDFINCIRRFVNRRGCPSVVYSDCGSNFKGATTELKEVIKLFDNEKIEQFATQKKIVWKFNPPSAPHMGGAWERLVRSVKEVLTALMKNKIMTDAQLYTLLTEVENILNRRPLTPVSDDVEDLQAITPNHLLLGLHRNWDYVCDVNDKDITSRRKYRQVQAVAEQFWKRWRKEYLPNLTTRSRWREPIRNYEVGELVVLVDDDVKRGKWPLGRVTRAIPSDDGIVRIVEVRTANGLYTRPVVKLCRLEDD